ncbi:hypothetical protein LMG9964_00793 [Paraburkholderia phenoliruptrix]|uniref:Uncharacterized protein n=1 Tax=Paraburkholderia phenoliruptrix TaxID=252970 RepID=A0A6J5JZJ6_9BURK|nr:hypothetical protein LMG9964_00793 [Paraburkholderia phenoliruptrix]
MARKGLARSANGLFKALKMFWRRRTQPSPPRRMCRYTGVETACNALYQSVLPGAQKQFIP